MTLFTTNKHHTIGVIPPSLKWSVVGTSQGINPAQAYLLRTFSGDPTRWCDNRGIKKSSGDSHFSCATISQNLRIANRLKTAWVQFNPRFPENSQDRLVWARWASYSEGAVPGFSAVASSRDRVMFEGLPQNQYKDPCESSHNRTPEEALWLDSWHNPQWVAEVLSEKPHANAGERGLKLRTFRNDERKTGKEADFSLPEVDECSWTALISRLTKRGQGRQALKIYAEMRESGMRLKSHTFVAALKACSMLRDLENVKRVHDDVVERGYESDVYVGTMLVDVYAKSGCLADARRAFEKISHRNVVSWNSMILGYAQLGGGEVALQLYRQMQEEGVQPDDRTFVCALKACSSLAALEQGVELDGRDVKVQCLRQVRTIERDTVKGGSELDHFVYTMLVDVYAKCGSLSDARRVFDQMPHRDVVSWNVIILGYAQMEEGEEALQLYASMQQEGVTPDERTFVGALKACGNASWLEKGKQIHAQILHIGLDATDSFVASSLVDMYGKCGSMIDSQRVFNSLPSRNIVTWSALIAGYARQGKSDIVFCLLQRMRQQGVEPNSVTFLSVLAVCSHEGLVGEGQKYFEAMSTDFGISPTMEHYTCMVDLLGRAGQVDDAMDMAKAMPFLPDCAVWVSVLGACRKWGKVDLGREAFDLAVGSNRASAAVYVLMANIYADAHMWEDVKDIQVMKDETRVWKQPGQSLCTDLGGSVHAFEVGDQEHPKRGHIYAKLQCIFDRMNDEGNERISFNVDVAKCS